MILIKEKYCSTVDLSKFKSYKKNILNDIILLKVKANITLTELLIYVKINNIDITNRLSVSTLQPLIH